MRWEPEYYQRLDRQREDRRFWERFSDLTGWLIFPIASWLVNRQLALQRRKAIVLYRRVDVPGGPAHVRPLSMTENERWAMYEAEHCRVAKINSLLHDRSSCPLP